MNNPQKYYFHNNFLKVGIHYWYGWKKLCTYYHYTITKTKKYCLCLQIQFQIVNTLLI